MNAAHPAFINPDGPDHERISVDDPSREAQPGDVGRLAVYLKGDGYAGTAYVFERTDAEHATVEVASVGSRQHTAEVASSDLPEDVHADAAAGIIPWPTVEMTERTGQVTVKPLTA